MTLISHFHFCRGTTDSQRSFSPGSRRGSHRSSPTARGQHWASPEQGSRSPEGSHSSCRESRSPRSHVVSLAVAVSLLLPSVHFCFYLQEAREHRRSLRDSWDGSLKAVSHPRRWSPSADADPRSKMRRRSHDDRSSDYTSGMSRPTQDCRRPRREVRLQYSLVQCQSLV